MHLSGPDTSWRKTAAKPISLDLTMGDLSCLRKPVNCNARRVSTVLCVCVCENPAAWSSQSRIIWRGSNDTASGLIPRLDKTPQRCTGTRHCKSTRASSEAPVRARYPPGLPGSAEEKPKPPSIACACSFRSAAQKQYPPEIQTSTHPVSNTHPAILSPIDPKLKSLSHRQPL